MSVHQLRGEFYYDCEVGRSEDTVVGSYVVETAAHGYVVRHPAEGY